MRAGRPDQPHNGALPLTTELAGPWRSRERGSLNARTAAGRSARVLGTGGDTADSGAVFSYLEARCFGVFVVATNARHARTGKLIIGLAKSAESRTITVLKDAATWTQLPFPMLRRDLRHMLA
jgi:hypothetical protein